MLIENYGIVQLCGFCKIEFECYLFLISDNKHRFLDSM